MESITQYFIAVYLTTCTKYDACTYSALAIYSELYTRYLTFIAHRLKSLIEHSGRSFPSTLDLNCLLLSLGIDNHDLFAFYRSYSSHSHLKKFIHILGTNTSISSINTNTNTNTNNTNNTNTNNNNTNLFGLEWLPELPNSEIVIDKVDAVKLRASDWTYKRPTNPFTFIADPDSSIHLSLLPPFSTPTSNSNIDSNTDTNNDSDNINNTFVELCPVEGVLPQDRLKQFVSSELLSTKTWMNYNESPYLIEFPPVKKRKFFIAPRDTHGNFSVPSSSSS